MSGVKRFSLRLTPQLQAKIAKVAAERGVSINTLLGGLLEQALTFEDAGELAKHLESRIGRLEQRMKGVKGDVEILAELVSLFIYHWFCYAPTIPESQRKAMQVEGKDRYDKFLELLEKRLSKGKHSVGAFFSTTGAEGSEQKGD